MKEFFSNSTVRAVLAGVLLIAVVGSIGTVVYLGQLNKSETLKSTRSKASTNTLTSLASACALDITIPTPTTIPTTVPPTPTTVVPSVTSIPPTITNTPTGVPTAVPTPISCNKNLDIAIVIDRSSSMTAYQTVNGVRLTKLEWVKRAASNLVSTLKNINANSVGVAVASFGSQGNFSQIGTGSGINDSSYDSKLNIPLTVNNLAPVLTGIPLVKYVKKGTCVQCGIRIGNKELVDTTAKRVVILLSDGKANTSWDGRGWLSSTNNGVYNAIQEATAGRANGIEYRVIGYGAQPNDIDETTLITIAGGIQNYQYKDDVAGWANSFMNILNDVCK